jgi:hypothetical protein
MKHLHAIWKAEDAIRAEMIARGEDPDAKPPGKALFSVDIQQRRFCLVVGFFTEYVGGVMTYDL